MLPMQAEFGIIMSCELTGKGREHMRTLATAAFSFAAVTLTAALLPERGWYLPAAGVLAVVCLAFFLLRCSGFAAISSWCSSLFWNAAAGSFPFPAWSAPIRCRVNMEHG